MNCVLSFTKTDWIRILVVEVLSYKLQIQEYHSILLKLLSFLFIKDFKTHGSTRNIFHKNILTIFFSKSNKKKNSRKSSNSFFLNIFFHLHFISLQNGKVSGREKVFVHFWFAKFNLFYFNIKFSVLLFFDLCRCQWTYTKNGGV